MRNHYYLLFFIVFLFAVPEVQAANDAEIIRIIQNRLQKTSVLWHDNLRPTILSLFWSLALISWTYQGMIMALRGADLPEIMTELVKLVLVTGFWLYIVQNSNEIVDAIVSSFYKAAEIATGGGVFSVGQITPGYIINKGIELGGEIIDMSGILDVILYGLFALIILLSYIYIAAVLFVVSIEGYMVTGAGIILLGFSASPWTSDIAKKYLIFAFGIGIKIFITLLIILYGETFARNHIDATSSDKSLLGLTGVIAMLAYLTGKVPQLAQSMISGISVSGPNDFKGIAATAGHAAATATKMAMSTGVAAYQAHRAASMGGSPSSNSASTTLAAASQVSSSLESSKSSFLSSLGTGSLGTLMGSHASASSQTAQGNATTEEQAAVSSNASAQAGNENKGTAQNNPASSSPLKKDSALSSVQQNSNLNRSNAPLIPSSQTSPVTSAAAYAKRFASAYGQGLKDITADYLVHGRSTSTLAGKIKENAIAKKIESLKDED